MADEILNIQWLGFKTNLQPSLQELRDKEDFFDVTLACKDGRSQAHRVVLGSCSPFFLDLLRSSSHPHPLIYLRGVKHKELELLLNFMYKGETEVVQGELDSLLATAEDLEVKGLTNKLNNLMKDIDIVTETSRDPQVQMRSETEVDLNRELSILKEMNITDPVMNGVKKEPTEEGYCMIKSEESELDTFKNTDLTNNNKLMDEYNQTVQTLIEKLPMRGHRCTQCSYSNVRRDCVLKHAQKHVFTTGLPCRFCDKKFNSENYLKRHVLKKHKII